MIRKRNVKNEIFYLFLGSCLYFAVAKLGMEFFSFQPLNISLLWLPFGIAVVLIELFGLKATLFIFVATFFAHFNSSVDITLQDIAHRCIAVLLIV